MVSSAAQQGANVAARQQDITDALMYLDEMQRELAGQPRVYADFLQVLQDFRNNPECVASRTSLSFCDKTFSCVPLATI